ncbi:MAG: TolB-like 6-bladed beta-propeller domain-containing protein [Gemmatimonadetes bacterium]|nr:TolB-like 6-bladed beta-propeller domain-containing protein [Gemmatimonadota bacterium]
MDPKLTVFDLSSGAPLYRFGHDGQGPGEFRYVVGIRGLPGQPAAARVYDTLNRRINWIEFPEDGGKVGATVRRELPFRLDVYIESLTEFGEGYLSSGFWGPSFSLLELDSAGVGRSRRWTPPAVSRGELDHEDGLRHVNKNHLAVHPDGSRAMLLYQEVNHVVAVDLSEGRYRAFRGPRETTPAFEVRPEGFGFLPEHVQSYFGADATEQYVYGLFCGCEWGDPEVRQTLPTTVHVFRWDGTFVTELQLDRGAITIEVQADDSRLWAFVPEPVPRVGEWLLPPDL